MDVIDYCKKFKSVFIYGSGIYGRMIYLYLQENPQYRKYRIDAISILLKPDVKIEHLKNISI